MTFCECGRPRDELLHAEPTMTDRPDVAALARAMGPVWTGWGVTTSSTAMREDAEAIIAALAAAHVKLATVESITDALEATLIGYNTDQRKLWAEAIWEALNG